MIYNMTNCPKVPLPELLSFIVDNRGKTVPTAECGHVLIATNCVRNEYLYPVFEKIRFLSDETYRTWFRAHPEPGDVIFVNKGTPGRVCMVPKPVNFCMAQDMIAFRPRPERLYNKYLLAVLRSAEIQTQIHNFNVGDVIPHFKKSFLGELLIPLPDMEIQNVIGDIYFDLSDKIANNTKINHHLEQMAQAIFKSWFVDFEPFGGVMPDDWREGTISDIAVDIVCGKTPSTKIVEYFGNDIPFITIPDMHNQTYITATERSLSFAGADSQSSKTVPANSVCVSCIATAGLVVLTSKASQTNQQINTIVCKDGIGPFYVYLTMLGMADQIQMLGSSGSATNNLNKGQFSKIEILIPKTNVIDEFSMLVSPIFEQIRRNQQESECLAALRDTLLPRLMSGELSVADRSGAKL